jgi:hypothetical protein
MPDTVVGADVFVQSTTGPHGARCRQQRSFTLLRDHIGHRKMLAVFSTPRAGCGPIMAAMGEPLWDVSEDFSEELSVWLQEERR